ncbi:hypothetical protein [Amycolatopsis sp. WAC 04197]|nr:hypothetical protein [Amycolatopsis sp. WAC 04197]
MRSAGLQHVYDQVKSKLKLETELASGGRTARAVLRGLSRVVDRPL